MLLQNLMCHADVDVVTNYWVLSTFDKTRSAEPFANLSVIKKRRELRGFVDMGE
jgi:Mycotoxin biosynthesis protein UstYa